MSEPTKKIINSLVSVTRHENETQTRLAIDFDGKNAFQPDIEGAIQYILAQNIAVYVNHFYHEHKHLPKVGDEMKDLVETSSGRTKMELLRFIAKGIIDKAEELFGDIDFVGRAVDMAHDILENDVGTLDEKEEEKTEAPAAEPATATATEGGE